MKSLHFPPAASDRPHARGAAKRKHKKETALEADLRTGRATPSEYEASRRTEPAEIQDYNPEADVAGLPIVPNGGDVTVEWPVSPAEAEFISGRPISGLESGPFLNLEERRSAFVAEITKMAPKLFGLPSANGLTALHNISVHLQIVNSKMKTILGSADRHGDLQVIHSACSHMLENLKVLIHLEEIN